jgi:probable F420-dependent oxidoreductase
MKIDAALFTTDLLACEARAAEIEAQGFAAAWSVEGQHDPFLPLALAARTTTRLELGTAIAVAFARNPMLCAQIAWDLQAITRGRFILGLGTQIRPHIERRYSQPWSRPAARMREFVQAIRAIWRCWHEREKLEFRGEFYTHTLMTPFFDPGPSPCGVPPIFVAGVGPLVTEVVGEVGDGFFVHPFHSPEFLRAETLPALERGLAKAGRARKDFQISCQTIVAIGRTPEQIESARQKARGQISFYGSTPSYRGVLDHHGYDALQLELNRLSKQGRWVDMMGLIDDALFDAIAVSGTPAEAGRLLHERNAGFADRTTLMLYDETGERDAVVELVRAAQRA